VKLDHRPAEHPSNRDGRAAPRPRPEVGQRTGLTSRQVPELPDRASAERERSPPRIG